MTEHISGGDGTVSRTDIINHLITKNGYKSYLEIGVSDPFRNFNKIEIEHKDAVDPHPRHNLINHPITSDEFFRRNDRFYDIIFIDGDHKYKQVKKDLFSALSALVEGGTIVMHDCNPPSKWHQRDEWGPEKKSWNGTCWKAFVEKRVTDPNLNMCVVDTDWGVGIISEGAQECWSLDPLADCLVYEYLETHRQNLLNIITTEQFLKLFK